MIYFIQQGDDGPIKIGFANSPEAAQVRLQTFQTGHSATLRLLHLIDGTLVNEAALHTRFAEHRVRGEWFAPVPELLELCQPLPSPEAVYGASERWCATGLICDNGAISIQGEIYIYLLEQLAKDDDADFDALGHKIDEWLASESPARTKLREKAAWRELAA